MAPLRYLLTEDILGSQGHNSTRVCPFAMPWHTATRHMEKHSATEDRLDLVYWIVRICYERYLSPHV